MKIFIAIAACFLLLAPAPATAQQKTREYKANSIQVLKNSATMRYQKDYFVTKVMGVVGKEGIPQIISLGDVIAVKDRTLTVNHIFVTECFVMMEWGGEVLCEKGQVQCLVVERPEDVPSDRDTHRLWITVDHCRPLPEKTGSQTDYNAGDKSLKGYKSPFVILPPFEWAGGDGSSPKEHVSTALWKPMASCCSDIGTAREIPN